MTADAGGTLPAVGGAAEKAVELVEPGTPGAIQCQAPGCTNWFVKRSGRHVFCRASNCTYRRGAPPEREVEPPTGAALEVLRRVQDAEEAEVGPALLAQRRQVVSESLRAGDSRALYGALCDEATACVWWADRAHRGELPGRPAPVVPGAPVTPAKRQQRPVGLVHAVMASHQRTYQLAERRVSLIWEMLAARERLGSAETGVAQMAGSPGEADARDVYDAAVAEYEHAQRSLESVEAAWRERTQAMAELSAAAASVGAGPNGGGARHGRG